MLLLQNKVAPIIYQSSLEGAKTKNIMFAILQRVSQIKTILSFMKKLSKLTRRNYKKNYCLDIQHRNSRRKIFRLRESLKLARKLM